MTSERLVDTLAAGLAPVRRRSFARDGLVVAGIAAIELVVLMTIGWTRPDLGHVMMRPFFWWKLGTMAALAGIGLAAALRSFDPTRSPRPGLRHAGLAVAAALAIGWLLDATHRSALPLAERMQWHQGVGCMVVMALLALPVLGGLAWLMRRSAPTDRAGTALAAGIGAGAWGGFLFVFACPHDDPFYVAVWYLAGCATVALAGRWLLAPMTRW